MKEGWEILESTLELDEVTGDWYIGTIGSLEKGVVEGTAELATTDLQEAKVSLRVFSAPFGRPLWQSEVEKTVPVRYPNVKTEITSNVSVLNK